MMIEKLKGEKLKSYKPIFIDRRTGRQDAADYTVSLFPSEVIDKQIEQSTQSIVVLYKECPSYTQKGA